MNLFGVIVPPALAMIPDLPSFLIAQLTMLCTNLEATVQNQPQDYPQPRMKS